jgi:BMFP domain-containing protein YqiC
MPEVPPALKPGICVRVFPQAAAEKEPQCSGAVRAIRDGRIAGIARASHVRAILRDEETTVQTQNRLLDDFARLMTDAAGAAQGVRREAETLMRAQAERFLRDMDLASREEVEVLRDLVTALRSQNDALVARVDALEAKLAEPKSGGTRGRGAASTA